jgi:light-regulated signal transduction histidine kinase (bacteriophytochrome)/CheY-like chemotaxis protein
LLPQAAEWDSVAAGLVAVPISRDLGEWLLWFRPSTERTIDWAGEPTKVVTVSGEGGVPRLSPRGSFELWRETVRGRSLPWQTWEVEAASSLRQTLLAVVRRRSAELRALNQKLTDADRAKDNFIAVVSHELRTPLNAITGWTQLLRSGSVPAERRAHAIEVISRNADAQSQLVEDLLDISRITSGKLTLEVQTVDFVAVVDGVLEAMQIALQAKGITLVRVLDTTGTSVLGDEARLRQVVTNLLTNAVKFTPKGGKIHVVLQRVSSDLVLTVRDSGQGISPEFLPHVFESFRQEEEGASRRAHGLGLGLAIVRSLVELHGGRVTAESEGLGRGAAFHVRLPLAPIRTAEPPPSRAPQALSGPPELAGARILVVEDEPDARELVRHVLERCGAVVVEAATAGAALEQTERLRFAAIVSDIGLPDTDGLGFLRELRSRGPERGGRTPAVALSAYTRVLDRTNALQAGFQAHVSKPVDATELVAVVASLIRNA